METYLALFIEFFKTGLFSVGGGLATLPFLYKIADRYSWFDHAMLTDMLAVSESTPGPIGVNVATYAGFHTKGVPGGLAATFALVLPSYIIIVIIARFLARFNENKTVKSVFYGLRPAVAGMIAASGCTVALAALTNQERFVQTGSPLGLINLLAVALFALLWFLLQKYKKHSGFHTCAAPPSATVSQPGTNPARRPRGGYCN